MRILITGAAGFLGSRLVEFISENLLDIQLIGIDNLSRKGSEYHLDILLKAKCEFIKGDIRDEQFVNSIPKVDWVIDCAAEPSVLAGTNTPLDLLHNNLTGTFHLLEKCRKDQAGFILFSTSRVYSIQALNEINLKIGPGSFFLDSNQSFSNGLSVKGISEKFSIEAPISIYGATKLASEILAKEYHYTFGIPVFINRCGVIAGAGQLGKIDQGIFSYWVYRHLLNQPLSYIGYGGKGYQVRDLIHPIDIFTLLLRQLNDQTNSENIIVNIGGGIQNTLSLYQLNEICSRSIKSSIKVNSVEESRQFDIPYYVTDYSKAQDLWNWSPTISVEKIIDEIIAYGTNNIEHIKSLFD